MRVTRILCNYFKRYVEYEMRQSCGVDYKVPIYGWVRKGKRYWKYSQFHPLSAQGQLINKTSKENDVVEPIRDWKIFRGDRVQVLIGKDKGRHGLVNFIIKERNWCYVEGLNCEYKLEEEFEGQPLLKKTEKPLLVTSEVRLVDPADNEPTDIEWKYTEDGKKVRVSVRSGRILPLPAAAEDYYDDFTQISSYKDGDKDTNKEELQRVTFQPSLKSFEEDIFDQMGIKEDRKPRKTYWY